MKLNSPLDQCDYSCLLQRTEIGVNYLTFMAAIFICKSHENLVVKMQSTLIWLLEPLVIHYYNPTQTF